MPSRRAPFSVRWATRALLALALLGSACGESPPEDLPAADTGRPRIRVAPVPPLERARYALERLCEGPEVQSALPLGAGIHARNLDLAIADLIALAPETLELLADEALRERYARGDVSDANPWHGILQVLAGIADKPALLAIRWARPALDRAGDVPLRRIAARCLATVPNPEVAPTLLEFLEADADDRIVGRLAVNALIAYGAPWRERALSLVLERGTPRLWLRAPEALAETVPPDQVDPGVATCMAWWARMSEGSGPRPPAGLPRAKQFNWVGARRALDPSVPRAYLETDEGRTRAWGRAGPFPATAEYGTGWLTASLHDQCVVPANAYFLSGKEPAADARCFLARWGDPLARAAIRSDRTLAGVDDVLYQAAKHCMDGSDETSMRTGLKEELVALLEGLRARRLPDPDLVARIVGGLPGSLDDPEAAALRLRVVRELRPFQAYRVPIEEAFEELAVVTPMRTAAIETMFASEDTEQRGAAFSLIKMSRDPAFIPLLEAALARAIGPEVGELRRLLVFLYSRRTTIEPRRYLAFVETFLGWLEDAPESERRGLLPALLDFGETGADAYARGLRGPKRRDHVLALIDSPRILPRSVAEAMVEGIDATTAASERIVVLQIAYGSFPATAANALASLAARLPASARPEVEVALARVRHRAAR